MYTNKKSLYDSLSSTWKRSERLMYTTNYYFMLHAISGKHKIGYSHTVVYIIAIK